MAANHTNTESSSTLRARSRLLRLAAVLLFTASCSRGSDASTTPTVLLTSTAPTTVATTTTTEATTTTEDPTIAYERDVAEITEVYAMMRLDLVENGLSSNAQAIAEFAVDPLLSIYLKNSEASSSQNHRLGTRLYEIQILDVDVDGDSATLTSCNLDGISLETADGQEIVPADTERYLRTTELVRTSEGWRIAATSLTGSEPTPCVA